MTSDRGRTRPVLTLAALVPVMALAGVSAAQVHLARRRYGQTQLPVPWFDTTVLPPGGTLCDDRPLELVTLGDSAVAGVGVHRLIDTLPLLVATRVASATGRPVHVVNHGRSGARTGDVLREQLPLITGRPDVAVVVVGTNDVTHLSQRTAFGRDTEAMLSQLNDLGAPVVMSSLPEFKAMRAIPPLVRAGLELRAQTIRKVQLNAARNARSVELVDVRALVGHEFVTDVVNMSADRFHPSPAGYARIADALAPAVASCLTPEVSGGLGVTTDAGRTRVALGSAA